MHILQSPMSAECVNKAQAHARAEYPRESCGVVVDGRYVPMKNIARPVETHEEANSDCACQLCSFEIDSKAYLKAGKVEMVVHSHPEGPRYPSQADMEGQLATGVPWAIIALSFEDAEWRVGKPVMWGDGLPIAPLIGRSFMHGVHDCYSLIRDTYRLGREILAEQGIAWPLDPIELPEVPRDDGWWKKGQDLYRDGIAKFGFRIVNASDARPGDIFLGKIQSKTINHAGVLLSDGTIMHHLPTRLSQRMPAGLYARAADMWVRRDA